MSNGSTITDEKFWAKVDKTGDCWLWIGSRTWIGYGHLTRGGRTLQAHRYVLALAGVEIGAGQVDHMCHVRACVRPDHLRIVTHKQNQENRRGAACNSRSGIRGVYWNAGSNRWRAEVRHNGVRHRKSFLRVEDAEAWAIAKRNELYTHNNADRAI